MSLILTGHHGDSFYIGDDVKVTVLSREYGGYKLVFDAPKSVVIDREKIHNRKLLEQDNARHKARAVASRF